MTLRIITGQFKGKTVPLPDPAQTRPTASRTRQAVFNILEHHLEHGFQGISFLDGFAGSGMLGLEALSRGAREGHFCETDRGAAHQLARTFDAWQVHDRTRLHAISFWDLPPCSSPVDLVFLDPPYKETRYRLMLEHLRTQGWISEATLIYVESEALPEVPPSWLADQRRYGRACCSFLRVG